MVKFKAGELMRMEQAGVLHFLDTLVVTKEYKAERLNRFLQDLLEKINEVAKKRDDLAMSIIEKYGTEEEITNKKLEETSPHYETAVAEYNEQYKTFAEADYEIDTDIDESFFKNGICWTANAVRNKLMIKELFGRA